MDADAALDCVKSFAHDKPVCAIIKHANPCGVALGDSLLNAYLKAYQCDPASAYGGIIAFNQTIDGETARAILEKQFVEVIIAPQISDEAKKLSPAKKIFVS